jgi:sporulation protein YlmC with PRC-barrel domain
MRSIMLAAVLILAVIIGYSVPNAVAYEMMGKSGETSEVSELLGKGVKNPKGEDLGTITDVVAGPEGRVAFAVLSYWVSADTQMRVAVPFSALSCEGQKCILNTSRETFDSAPTFVLEGDLAEQKLAEDIYRYFGVQPYWTEEGTEK